MSEHKDLYLIRWTGTDGQESLVAITDNLDKWLEYNNKSFKSEVLKLSMFNIEQIETHIFDKVKERI
tara:strand:+ start:3223 stop:3423 length:201 start_codon:yes stop_codon:yes gene_type:complete